MLVKSSKFLVFAALATLAASCGGSHKKSTSPAPADQPVQDTKPQPKPSPSPSPAPEPATLAQFVAQMQTAGKTYKSACSVTPNGSADQVIAFTSAKTIVVNSYRYEGKDCISLRYSVTREGQFTLTADEKDARKAQIAITFDKDFWYVRYPTKAQTEACPVSDYRDLSGLYRSSDECKMELPAYAAEWALADDDKSLTVPGVSDAIAGYADAYTSTMKEAPSFPTVTATVPEQMRCRADVKAIGYDAATRVCQRGEDFISASAESYIEYQKDTGLYPRVKAERRVLVKAEGLMQYLIDYEFVCDVTDRFNRVVDEPNMFAIGMEENDMYYVAKGKQRKEIVGRGDLIVRDQHSMSMAWLFGIPKVKDGCSLTIQVQSNKLAD